MLLRHAIGSTIRRLRLERAKTLRELARESTVSLPYLSEIERGRKEASSEILATLARSLDVTLESIVHEASERLELTELGTVTDLQGRGIRADDAVLLAA